MEYNINGTQLSVSVYGERMFKVKIGGGGAPKSGAILPQQLYESNEAENETAFIISTSALSLNIKKSELALFFLDKNGGVIAGTYPEAGYSKTENGGFSLNFHLDPNEHIYGLGEDNDVDLGALDRRGTVRDMITGQRINRARLTADFPIPFILSAGNIPYGLYIDNTYNLSVDIGKTVSDKLSVTAPGGACEFWFIGGDSANEVVQSFSALTGRAKLPPLWTLGYIQSKACGGVFSSGFNVRLQ